MQHGSFHRRIGALALAALAVGGYVSGSGGSVGAAEDFVLGSGNAQAQLVRIGPAAGHLALAPTIGLSLADYLSTVGRGESRIFEWGALDGSVPADFKAKTPSVRSTSTDDGSDKGADAAPIGTPAGAPFTAAAMQQHADSTKKPVGHSTFTLGAFSVPGAVEMSGGIAETTSGIVKDGVRSSVATVRIGRLVLGGGAVTLTGLKWEAVQRTGSETVTTASFTVDGATAAGQTLAPPKPDQLATFFSTLNGALATAQTGLVIDPPATSTTGGLATVSPLGIRMVNSPIGNTAVAPIVGAAQPVREPVTGGLIANCAQCSSGVLVADVFAGVVTGGGRFDLEVGGANGYTEGTRYDVPFNFDFSSFSSPALGATNDFADSGFASDSSSYGGSTLSSGFSGGGTAANPALAGTGTGGGVRSPGSLNAVTASKSSPLVPGKKGGAAAAVGLAGLLGALALAGAEYRSIRMARRTIPA
ncbi:MAG: hypothetical protein QOF60_1094 [Actinomycetota bacterium]|jgi:hypothetical protein|nr:hypothetical protein [Actinomycetota bacterium]